MDFLSKFLVQHTFYEMFQAIIFVQQMFISFAKCWYKFYKTKMFQSIRLAKQTFISFPQFWSKTNLIKMKCFNQSDLQFDFLSKVVVKYKFDKNVSINQICKTIGSRARASHADPGASALDISQILLHHMML